MPRPRKFQIGEVVVYDGQECVVVDYRQDRRKRGSYRLVRLTHLPAGRGYGPAVWVESYHIQEHPDHTDRRWTAVRYYRANAKMGERGCDCQCCPHVAVDPGIVLEDGTYRGE